MKILVTGAKGQLGSEIKALSSNSGHSFEFIDQEELDLTNLNSIDAFLYKSNPDFIINCAAYTAVDKAEDEPELARKINADAPGKIAQFCQKNNTRLIHISTDYVFNGAFDRPIKEDDQPNPQSVYGKTKLDGERAINQLLDNAYIIRTAWVYSSFGNNFVKTMLRLGKEKSELNVVSDQIGSPTYARDLAEAILGIIQEIKTGNDLPGVYHYSNEGVCSWYDFASEIIRLAGLGCNVKPIPTLEFPTKAKRPEYSVLDKNKIIKQFNLKLPEWKASLSDCLEIIKQ